MSEPAHSPPPPAETSSPTQASSATQASSSAAAPPSSQLPEWLQQLATESWQVELLISGFAIVGTAQLSDFLEPLAAYALFTFRADVIGFIFYAHIYLLLGFALLPAIFAAHFAVRAFWVGVVGLASVYPGGIGPERTATIPEVYVARVRERYPPLPVWIDRTERVASLMFVTAALLAMSFVGTAVAVVALVTVAYLVELATGGAVPFSAAATILVAAMVAVFLLQQFLRVRGLRDQAWAQRAYLALAGLTQYVLYNVFVHPVTYLFTVLFTNIRSASGFPLAASMTALVIVLFAAAQPGPLTEALYDFRSEARDQLRADRYDANRYRSDWTAEDHVSLVPYVEDERVAAGEWLEVSVPLLGEDRYRIGLRTPDAPPSERDANDEDGRAMRHQRELAARKAYLRFRLDSVTLATEDLVRYELPNRERGVRALVRLPPKLPTGRHTLWVDRRADPVAAAGRPSFEPAAAIPLLVEE